MVVVSLTSGPVCEPVYVLTHSDCSIGALNAAEKGDVVVVVSMIDSMLPYLSMLLMAIVTTYSTIPYACLSTTSKRASV